MYVSHNQSVVASPFGVDFRWKWGLHLFFLYPKINFEEFYLLGRNVQSG
jgi:hypothetical protein